MHLSSTSWNFGIGNSGLQDMDSKDADLTSHDLVRPLSGSSSSHAPKRRRIDTSSTSASNAVEQFICGSCNKHFQHKKTLVKHQKTHALDAVRFQCTECEQTFSQDYDRRRHKKQQHGEGKEACEYCGKYIRPDGLRDHWKTKACMLAQSKLSEQILATSGPDGNDIPSENDSGISLDHLSQDKGNVVFDHLAAMSPPQDALSEALNLAPDSDSMAMSSQVTGGAITPALGPEEENQSCTSSAEMKLTVDDAHDQDTHMQGLAECGCDGLGVPQSGSVVRTSIAAIESHGPGISPAVRPRLRNQAAKRRSRFSLLLDSSRRSLIRTGAVSEQNSADAISDCPLCGHMYETEAPELQKHLGKHMVEYQYPFNRCDICQVDFAYRKDLLWHQTSARQGHCGFEFSHKGKCAGRHAPIDFAQEPFEMSELDFLSDHDWFDGPGSPLRVWEHSQLQMVILQMENIRPGCCGKEIARWSVAAFIRRSISTIVCRLSFQSALSAKTAPAAVDMEALQHGLSSLKLESDGSLALVAPRGLLQDGCMANELTNAASSGFGRPVSNRPSLVIRRTIETTVASKHNVQGLDVTQESPAEGDHSLMGALAQACLDQLLYKEVQNGDFKKIESLLSQGAVVNTQLFGIYKNNGALYEASRAGLAIVARCLLQYGADAADEAFLASVDASHEGTVRVLLDHGANANAGQDGVQALHRAVYQGSVTIVAMLLDAGANALDAALFAAVFGPRERIARLLLDRGANANAEEGGEHILWHAAQQGSIRMVTMLLEAGAAPSDTAFREAVSGCHVEVAIKMIAAGAHVNGRGHDHPLQSAAYHGEPRLISALLNAGADVNARGGEFGTALHAAAACGMVESVRLLVSSGADVNATCGQYGTALQAAATPGRVELMNILLDSGADVNALGGKYGTALCAAVCGSFQQVVAVQILLANGAAVNTVTKEGTALAVAKRQLDRSSDYSWRQRESKEIIQLLLDAGAME